MSDKALLADLPLEERQKTEADNLRDIQDGITRRHLAMAEDRARVEAVHLARLLRNGPALSAKLRGD